MTLRPCSRWVLTVAGVAAGLLSYHFVGTLGWQFSGPEPLMAAEARARELRRLTDTIPTKRAILEGVSAERAQRQQGVLEAERAALAYAQLWGVLRRVNESRNPPIDFGGVEFGDHVERLSDEFGEIQIRVSFTCRMDQLVAVLADLPRQPELIATRQIQISAADSRQKTINVRLTVSAVVPGRLAMPKAGEFNMGRVGARDQVW